MTDKADDTPFGLGHEKQEEGQQEQIADVQEEGQIANMQWCTVDLDDLTFTGLRRDKRKIYDKNKDKNVDAAQLESGKDDKNKDKNVDAAQLESGKDDKNKDKNVDAAQLESGKDDKNKDKNVDAAQLESGKGGRRRRHRRQSFYILDPEQDLQENNDDCLSIVSEDDWSEDYVDYSDPGDPDFLPDDISETKSDISETESGISETFSDIVPVISEMTQCEKISSSSVYEFKDTENKNRPKQTKNYSAKANYQQVDLDQSEALEESGVACLHPENVGQSQEEHQSSTNMKNLYVGRSRKTQDGKRIWDKKHCCLYCCKQYSKIARHLEQVHGTELEVQKALSYNKKSNERKAAWRDLMNRGDFANNMEVLEKGEGQIIPFKRPNVDTQVKATDYIQCSDCLGTFLRHDLWRHAKNCKHHKNSGKKSKFCHQVASAALLPMSPSANKKFRENILGTLANDDVSFVARTDADIVEFGEKLYQKHARNPHQHQYIRQKMRELARFLQCARDLDFSVVTLRDCIDSLKFDVCVEAVKILCGYDKSSMLFKTPSLASKIGHSLHKIARRIKTGSNKTGDQKLKQRVENFIENYVEDWEVEIGHAALETREIQKYNKPTRIPLAEDLKALTELLRDKAQKLTDVFKQSTGTQKEFRELTEVTLAQVVLLNKKRAGEAERLEVQQYVDGISHGKNMQEEVLLALSEFEKKLAEIINRVEIRGKRGRRVAILLPENLKTQLDILLKNRKQIGRIDESNIFMFARAGDATTPVRSADVLRKFASECNAKHPELLTSTLFRKHVAVIVQMLNLKENELDVLASFLGHDIKVHRNFYRLPEDTLQIAKVSKLLLELEKGNLHNYKGKSLDEIQMDLDEPLEEDVEEEENESICTEHLLKETMPSTIKKKSELQKNPRRPWSDVEKDAVKRQLGRFFFVEKLPGKHEIELARKKEPVLMRRRWDNIKFFIKNEKTSLRKKTLT